MMRCVQKYFLRLWNERIKRKKRDDKAAPNGQQHKDYTKNIDDNFLGTKCFSFNKEDSEIQGKKPKEKAKFTEFCTNAFCKLFCCVSEEISGSQECKLAISELGLDDISRYKQNVIDDYEFKEIGKGNFGTVRLAVSKTSDERVAIKTIQKKQFCPQQRREIKREQKAWASSSSHLHVVTLLALFTLKPIRVSVSSSTMWTDKI
ncbi:uncharacterized protein LOC111618147 [Centruroides sculpturatus]|uniref:uncharacterized protein LOC111618147 n=1 Tax=Centruroides sculpturatus TaxID=218467 RepID=UPI000C6D0917|nr:uncharacterized protein LOC111618147 [Centruroides sculpturatus]